MGCLKTLSEAVCRTSSWTLATSVGCMPRAALTNTFVSTLTVRRVAGTLVLGYSLDAAIASSVSSSFVAAGDDSVAGLGFSGLDMTVTAAVEHYACSTSSWVAAAALVCDGAPVLLGRLTRTTDTAPGPARLKEPLRSKATT